MENSDEEVAQPAQGVAFDEVRRRLREPPEPPLPPLPPALEDRLVETATAAYGPRPPATCACGAPAVTRALASQVCADYPACSFMALSAEEFLRRAPALIAEAEERLGPYFPTAEKGK